MPIEQDTVFAKNRDSHLQYTKDQFKKSHNLVIIGKDKQYTIVKSSGTSAWCSILSLDLGSPSVYSHFSLNTICNDVMYLFLELTIICCS